MVWIFLADEIRSRDRTPSTVRRKTGGVLLPCGLPEETTHVVRILAPRAGHKVGRQHADHLEQFQCLALGFNKAHAVHGYPLRRTDRFGYA